VFTGMFSLSRLTKILVSWLGIGLRMCFIPFLICLSGRIKKIGWRVKDGRVWIDGWYRELDSTIPVYWLMKRYMKRLTSDLDIGGRFGLEVSLLGGRLLGFILHEIRRSPNNNFHIVWASPIAHTSRWKPFVRWFLGDDLMRIILDRRRPVSAREVLFTSKKVMVIER